MRIISVVIAFALNLTTQAAAFDLEHQASFNAKPKPVASLNVANRRIEMLAVTWRARADTPLERAHLDDCRNMAEVLPGYPQPAFISIDFRIKF